MADTYRSMATVSLQGARRRTAKVTHAANKLCLSLRKSHVFARFSKLSQHLVKSCEHCCAAESHFLEVQGGRPTGPAGPDRQLTRRARQTLDRDIICWAGGPALPEISQRWVAYAPRPTPWVLLFSQPPGPPTHRLDGIRQSATAASAAILRACGRQLLVAFTPPSIMDSDLVICAAVSLLPVARLATWFTRARTSDVVAVAVCALAPSAATCCHPDAPAAAAPTLPERRTPGRYGRWHGDAASIRAPWGRPPPPPLIFFRFGHVLPLAVVAVTVVLLRRPSASLWPPLDRHRRFLPTSPPMRPSWPAGRAS